MSDYVPELNALTLILLENKNYHQAIFKTNMEEKLSQIGKKKMQENVQGVLRHYFRLSFECMDLFNDSKDSQEHILLLIALYELRYHPSKDKAEIKASYLDAFKKMRLLGDCEKNIETLLEASKKPFVFSEEVKKAPYLYNSLLLEAPEFLLKKLTQDFTPQRSLDILSNLKRKPTYFFSLSNKGSQDEILTNEKFQSVVLENRSVLFKTETPLPLKDAKKLNLYPVDFLQMLAFSRVSLPNLTPKVLFTGFDDGFSFLPIGFQVEEYYKGELIVAYEHPTSYRSGMDCIRHFQLKKSKSIESNLALLKTYVQAECFDLVCALGKDTRIALSRRDPSILPSLKEDSFLKAEKRQLADLLENALFVKEGGVLLFINHSLVKQETYDVINRFLEKRKDFMLIKKEILFPGQMDGDGGFYCVLRRKEKQHD